MAARRRYSPDMGRRVDFTLNHRGVGIMLNSFEMMEALRPFGEEIKMRAEAMAPVYQGKYWGNTGRFSGRYKVSFHIRSRRYGGTKGDRAQVQVYNDSPEAFWVEFGNRGDEPYHVLHRAAFGRWR
jgi:hypothetical protein